MSEQPEEANSGFPDDLKADLASKIAELDNAQGAPGTRYRIVRVLKERSGETTELLEDMYGARYIRKRFARQDQVLHSCNPPIIHRDLNPSNIVAGPDGPCIIDFGIARTFDPAFDKDTHTWGTYGYAAPKQFGFGQNDERTDIFALGMLYWFLLTGTYPDANLEQQLARTSGQNGESDGGEDAGRPHSRGGAVGHPGMHGRFPGEALLERSSAYHGAAMVR